MHAPTSEVRNDTRILLFPSIIWKSRAGSASSNSWCCRLPPHWLNVLLIWHMWLEALAEWRAYNITNNTSPIASKISVLNLYASALHLPKKCQDTFLKTTFMVFTQSWHSLVLKFPRKHYSSKGGIYIWVKPHNDSEQKWLHTGPVQSTQNQTSGNTSLQRFSYEIKTRSNYLGEVKERSDHRTAEFYLTLSLCCPSLLLSFVHSPAWNWNPGKQIVNSDFETWSVHPYWINHLWPKRQ